MNTSDNISRIQQNLRAGNFYPQNPHEAANDNMVLAGEFSYLCSLVETILQSKPRIWNEMRPNYKSDTACERAWEATEQGMEEARLRLTLRSCEKMMSALRGLVRLSTLQVLNQ